MFSTQLPTVGGMNTWWTLSEQEQQSIKDIVPDQTTWTLDCVRRISGVWTFSLPQFKTYNESLTGGTELVLDHHFEKKTGYMPAIDSKMTLTVSSEPMPDQDTICTWHSPELDSNFYIDQGTGMKLWLCPYLQVLFKSVPRHLYVKFTDLL